MANSRTLSKSPEKPSSTAAAAHSQLLKPFHISAALFHNKRLKQKRAKWAAAAAPAAVCAAPPPQCTLKITNIVAGAPFPCRTPTNRRNSNNRKRCIAKTAFTGNGRRPLLPPELTIDLLSDDEDADAPPPAKVPKHNSLPTPPPPAEPEFQHFYVCPERNQLSRVPNITLVPLQNFTPPAPTRARAGKRKRKSQQPQRHAQPTLVNDESIILTDDSDTEEPAAPPPPPSIVPPPAPKVVISSAQVDEEVTVSIVPRSSTTGSCPAHAQSKAAAAKADKESALFPMLPDETTVHTVIANRIYELSLTKLREGLATCGISEFADGQPPKPSKGGRQKIQTYAPPPAVVSPPQQAPISLKLSSDLSISLISDDEEDAVEAHRRARKLLQAQPQLSVQQVPLPHGVAVVGANSVNSRQPPRRRKLG